MTIFLVERYLADIDRQALKALPARLEAAATKLRRSGVEVTYLDSTFLPEEEYCFCRFEAPSLQATELVNRIAGAPYARISPTVRLGAEGA